MASLQLFSPAEKGIKSVADISGKGFLAQLKEAEAAAEQAMFQMTTAASSQCTSLTTTAMANCHLVIINIICICIFAFLNQNLRKKVKKIFCKEIILRRRLDKEGTIILQ